MNIKKTGLQCIHVYTRTHTEAAAGFAPKLNDAPLKAGAGFPKANELEEELAPNVNVDAFFASSLAGGAPKIPAVDAEPLLVEPNETAALVSSFGGGAPNMLAVDTLPDALVLLAAPKLKLLVLLTLSSLSSSPKVNFGAGRVGNAAIDGGTVKSMASGSENV